VPVHAGKGIVPPHWGVSGLPAESAATLMLTQKCLLLA
jgi:hypothetical protein